MFLHLKIEQKLTRSMLFPVLVGDRLYTERALAMSTVCSVLLKALSQSFQHFLAFDHYSPRPRFISALGTFTLPSLKTVFLPARSISLV
jgi:hypothetical protein